MRSPAKASAPCLAHGNGQGQRREASCEPGVLQGDKPREHQQPYQAQMPVKPGANPRRRHTELSPRLWAAGAERGAPGPACTRATQGEAHALGSSPSKHDLD